VRLIGIGWILQGGRFLAAPLMAMLSEYDISRRARSNTKQIVQRNINVPVQSTEA
jgi:hypothetical protein